MKEFYIETRSFAAPFFSDEDYFYIKAKTPVGALKKCVKQYTHPCGLYAALAFGSADDEKRGKEPLARWLCNHEIEKMRLTKKTDGYSYFGHGPGDFEIDGYRVKVDNPKDGRVI